MCQFESFLRQNKSQFSDFSFLNENIFWFLSSSDRKLNIFELWTKQDVFHIWFTSYLPTPNKNIPYMSHRNYPPKILISSIWPVIIFCFCLFYVTVKLNISGFNIFLDFSLSVKLTCNDPLRWVQSQLWKTKHKFLVQIMTEINMTVNANIWANVSVGK